jgi:hypothetical protein
VFHTLSAVYGGTQSPVVDVGVDDTGVFVGVFVATFVAVLVAVFVGVFVAVALGIILGVIFGVAVASTESQSITTVCASFGVICNPVLHTIVSESPGAIVVSVAVACAIILALVKLFSAGLFTLVTVSSRASTTATIDTTLLFCLNMKPHNVLE